MSNQTPNAPEQNDPLDALLRGADEYIPDDGFTARVIASLAVKRRNSWRRFVILAVATLAGACLMAWQWPAVIALLGAMPGESVPGRWQALVILVPLLAALASLGWGLFVLVFGEE